VESVRAYKPVPDVYAVAQSAVGASEPRDVIFVSSNRWDVAGAAAFGFSAVWVNRSGLPDEYPGWAPVATSSDLAGVEAFAAT
jgi:2-haloacid dehalogenase